MASGLSLAPDISYNTGISSGFIGISLGAGTSGNNPNPIVGGNPLLTEAGGAIQTEAGGNILT